MFSNRLIFILLGLFLTLFGIFAVSSIKLEWGSTLMGYSALAAGIVCLIRGLAGSEKAA